MGDANTPTAAGPVEPTALAPLKDHRTADPNGVEPGSVHVIVDDTHARVVLSGEIDAEIAPDLQQATADVEAAGLPVEVDAHHVTFMDSTGVAFLARLTAVAPSTVRVLNTPPTVKFLLEVTRIGSMLEIVDDELSTAD